MRSTIDSKGQTIIPAAICSKFNLSPADHLEWIVENGFIRIVPVKADAIAAFRGQGKGGSADQLLSDRQDDKERE